MKAGGAPDNVWLPNLNGLMWPTSPLRKNTDGLSQATFLPPMLGECC